MFTYSVPAITVTISEIETHIIGESYMLECNVSSSGINKVVEEVSYSYMWIKRNHSHNVTFDPSINILRFEQLKLSDAGRYTCVVHVTVGSDSSLQKHISANNYLEVKLKRKL